MKEKQAARQLGVRLLDLVFVVLGAGGGGGGGRGLIGRGLLGFLHAGVWVMGVGGLKGSFRI